MDFVKAIRDRREKSVQRALSMLELYSASDAATRPPMLVVAAKSLADSRVVERWISILAAESDQGVRRSLLQYLSALDFRQIPQSSGCIAQLLACVQQPDARDWALHCLSRIAPRDPSIIAPLTAAYRTQRDADTASEILDILLESGSPPPELAAFFVSILDDVDEDQKISIVRKLLEQDALPLPALEKLLAPTEPHLIKLLVLDHLIDRSIRLDSAATKLLRQDGDAAVRYAAIWALTETGTPPQAALEALLAAAGSDPDQRVREFAISAFEHTLAKTPAVITGFLESIRHETSAARVSLLIRLLAPHIQRAPDIVPALTKLLEENLQADIALEIYALLGTLAPWNPTLLPWLIAAVAREREDRVKAAILKPLSRMNSAHPALKNLYAEALKLPEPEIQQWGVQGLLLLPITQENSALLIEGAALLLSRDIPLEMRVALARKLSAIPEKPPALLESLKKTSEQARDTQLKQICESVVNEVVSNAVSKEGITIDWKAWIHRAEIEHRADGIFPAIYEHYDDAPDSGKRVLKALLNPQCSNSLYATYGYDVSEHSILDFLDRKDAMDDDLSRFCVGKILTQDAGTPNGYLEFLIANPNFPPLKENILEILERRFDASTPLLRHLLVCAHGDDNAAAQALSARMNKLSSAELLQPYVRLLIENLAWVPAKDLLSELAARREIQADAGTRNKINEALEKFGPVESKTGEPPKTQEKPGPGFADD